MGSPAFREGAVILVLGAVGTDGPHYELRFKDGHFVLVPVPGWNPDLFREFESALAVIEHASRIKDPGISKSILQAATPAVLNAFAPFARDAQTFVVARSATATAGRELATERIATKTAGV